MQVENGCKITEIFCIIDDFCKEFSKIESKKAVFDGKRHRNKTQFHERCRGYFDNDYVPHGRLQMPQALLSQSYMYTLPAFVSQSGFLQPFCGIGDGSDAGNRDVCQVLPSCRMYWNILC